jgi:septal ring factor EnvC (AmiA/AmiB activator)
VKQQDGAPLTEEQIQQIDNSMEFHQLLQTEQAAQFSAQSAKVEDMGKTIAALMQDVKSLQENLQAVQAAAKDATESAANAAAAAKAADERAAAVALEVNKIKGAPMVMRTEDRAPEGTPEGASNEQYNAFVRMRDIFAQSKPLEEAIESAMKATGYNPNK